MKQSESDYYGETVSLVCIGDGQWIPVRHVEVLDISEDIFGVDTMTFNYEGRTYTSTIRIGR